MKKLKPKKGKERIRSTKATVLIKKVKKNNLSNQSAELTDKYKPGRHLPKVSELRRKKKEADAAVNDYLTPESSSTMNFNWSLQEPSDFQTFIFTTQTTPMDENDFNKGMETIFGQVSRNNKPIISVTTEHIQQLKSLSESLSVDDRSQVTAWISRLQKYCCMDNSDDGML